MSARHRSPNAQPHETAHPPGLVAVPCVPWIWTTTANALLQLSHALPAGSGVFLSQHGPSSIAAARNELVRTVLASPKYRWLLFVDSDMAPPPHTAMQLLSHDVDVVSGYAVQRHPPYRAAMSGVEPVASRSGLVRVARVGVACMLIRRSVLGQMPAPWFEHTTEPGLGEDYHFCAKLEALGVPIYVDMTLQVGHVTPMPITADLAATHQATDEGRAQLAAVRARDAVA